MWAVCINWDLNRFVGILQNIRNRLTAEVPDGEKFPSHQKQGITNIDNEWRKRIIHSPVHVNPG